MPTVYMRDPRGVMSSVDVNVHDIVRISSGQELIVTGFDSRRPANPLTGVLTTGFGKEYKFGAKHRPVVIGKATPDAPALQMMQAKVVGKSDSSSAREQCLRLMRFASDSDAAKFLALSAVDIGGTILYRGAPVEYLGVNPGAVKYQVSIQKQSGGRFRVPIGAISFVQ